MSVAAQKLRLMRLEVEPHQDQLFLVFLGNFALRQWGCGLGGWEVEGLGDWEAEWLGGWLLFCKLSLTNILYDALPLRLLNVGCQDQYALLILLQWTEEMEYRTFHLYKINVFFSFPFLSFWPARFIWRVIKAALGPNKCYWKDCAITD